MAEAPRILYRDEHLLVAHKPAGLLVHRSPLDPHESRFAVQWLRRAVGRRVYPVHRLDKPASGALLFALDRGTAAALGAQVRRHALARTYLAVVRGHPADEGAIDHALSADPDPADTRPGELREEVRAPRPAITRFRSLARVELPHRVDRYPTSRYSLLQLEPLTGRRHQLRRHLAHASHPIVGDTTWGKGAHNRLFATLFGCRRLLLAGVELGFVHPTTGEAMTIAAPLQEDFAGLVESLDWSRAIPPRWLPGPLDQGSSSISPSSAS